MNHKTITLINTRLQPGGEGVRTGEPFQRLAGSGKTVETVLIFPPVFTGLKPGVNNEMTSLIDARFNSQK